MILRRFLFLPSGHFSALLSALLCGLLSMLAWPAMAAETGVNNPPACCPIEMSYIPNQSDPEGPIKIAAGKVFGSYWTHANWLKKQVKTIVPVETLGPLHNLSEVLQGDAILGYSSLSMLQAVESAVGKPEPILCLAFPLYETPLSWVLLQQEAEQQTLSNLPAGFNLGAGPEYSSTDWMFRGILSILGKEVKLTHGTWVGLHQQFDQGQIAALAYAAGVPNPQIKRLFRKSDSNKLLSVKGFTPQEMTLIQDKLHLHPYTILENTYQNQITPINSASFWNYAITQCQINSELIYELTRQAMSEPVETPNPQEAWFSEDRQKFWSQTRGIPFHPGAIRFFKEKGIDLSQKN